MTRRVAPLTRGRAIVDGTGAPTSEFMDLWNRSVASPVSVADAEDTATAAATDAASALTAAAAAQSAANAVAARTVTGTDGLTGGGALTSNVTLAMPNVITPATFGGAGRDIGLTVDAKGRIVAYTDTAASGGGGPTSTPLTLASSGLTLVQGVSGNGAALDTSAGVYLNATSAGSVDRNVVLRRTIPASTFTATAKLHPNCGCGQYRSWGLCLADNATGRYHTFTAGPVANGGLPILRELRWTTLTSFSSSIDSAADTFTDMGAIYVRLTLTASDIEFHVSNNGVVYRLLRTVARSAWLANVSHVGVWMGVNAATVGLVEGVLVEEWVCA